MLDLEGAPASKGGAVNESHITLVGNAVTDVRLRATSGGVAFATFRMASNPRRFDRESARWVDGDPLFVTVVCWRTLAENAAASIAPGDPVVVTGRLRVKDWESGDKHGTSVEVDAIGLGHDLSRGRSVFTRVRRDAAEQALAAAALASRESTPAQADDDPGPAQAVA